MTATLENPATSEPPLPAVPDEATMVTLKIYRFNPEDPDAQGFESFRVPALPTDRLLNLLLYVKGYLDGSLTFRRSCAHGVCGSDAMRVNGVNRLACKLLMKDFLPKDGSKEITISIEPIKGLPVEKDLVVDMEPFFDAYRAIKPFLITSGNEPTAERLQSQADRARFDDTTKCILCACCTTSCPVFWNEGSYFGPAAIVNAHRFIFDSRDEAAAERLDILNDVDGVWRCRTTFNCTDACPRGIQVTQAIQEVKRALMFSR
ncbi:succinate dehydrogenase iron-sulfur subunit [Gordonia sp. HY002]|uniref:succinate dehydrogenase iron-sulfur subunit n=1 Tax=Gordonia zhenghanii TaxID=2911516 RepID=UPI001EF07578|nr:succinate dehydrogenase iron-sulfur subunit [Gordonia zhenghanii]MCF8570508.1 succinate dehydrogenase iron-sulfur subunit [Gordonia zhenghanii]MCF8602535.1 succinate dehydrogenase iron-sulfur subunit [Gordonia zhenghanii]